MIRAQFSDKTSLTSTELVGTKWNPEKVLQVTFTQAGEKVQATDLATTLATICKREVKAVKMTSEEVGKHPFDSAEKIAKFGPKYAELVKKVRPLKDALDGVLASKKITFEIYLGGMTKNGNGDKSAPEPTK